MNEIRYIPHHLISPDADQPRKTFAPDRALRMKQSILRHGVRRNLEVVETEPGLYRIVSGERRWRGTDEVVKELTAAGNEALAAERTMLPCMILTGAEVGQAKGLSLLENMQREGLRADEEAQGYASLQKEINPDTGVCYTIQEIAFEVSEEPKYVERRLKLLNAPPVLLDAINNGLAATIGEECGRIPEAKERERFAKMVLYPVGQTQPLNYLQAQELRRKEFVVSLKGCGFDKNDATLVPVVLDDAGGRAMGGSCEDCPFRTGRMTDLDGLVATTGNKGGKGSGGGHAGVDPQSCALPACFRDKLDANFLIVRRHAEESGQRVLSQTEAKSAFSGYQGDIGYDADWVDTKKKVSQEAIEYSNKVKDEDLPKWDKLLAEESVPVVAVQHPTTGKVHYLAPKKAAFATARAKLLGTEESAPEGSSSGGRDYEKEERERSKLRALVGKEVATELLDAIQAQGVDVDQQFNVFELAMSLGGADSQHFMGRWLDLKVEKRTSGRDFGPQILAHVKGVMAMGKPSLEALTVIALLARRLKYNGAESEDVKDFARLYKVDIAAIEKRVKASLKPKGAKKEPEEASAAAATGEKAGTWGYHCDCCGIVCDVRGDLQQEVRNTTQGEFLCDLCAAKTKDGVGWPKANQSLYVAWKPEKDMLRQFTGVGARFPTVIGDASKFGEGLFTRGVEPEIVYDADAELKGRIRKYRETNPTNGAGAIADHFEISIDEATRIMDALIDEEFDARAAAKAKPETQPTAPKKRASKKAKAA